MKDIQIEEKYRKLLTNSEICVTLSLQRETPRRELQNAKTRKQRRRIFV